MPLQIRMTWRPTQCRCCIRHLLHGHNSADYSSPRSHHPQVCVGELCPTQIRCRVVHTIYRHQRTRHGRQIRLTGHRGMTLWNVLRVRCILRDSPVLHSFVAILLGQCGRRVKAWVHVGIAPLVLSIAAQSIVARVLIVVGSCNEVWSSLLWVYLMANVFSHRKREGGVE